MMPWETIAVLILIGMLILPFETLREFRSRRCPTCGSHMRKTGLTHFIPLGEATTWLCPVCGTRTYGDQQKEAE